MTPESKVKAKITKFLKELLNSGESIYWFTPIGSAFGRSGVPDIIVCCRGRFVGIEVKAPGKLNNVTPLQSRAHLDISLAGGKVFLTDDAEQFKEDFRKWMPSV